MPQQKLDGDLKLVVAPFSNSKLLKSNFCDHHHNHQHHHHIEALSHDSQLSRKFFNIMKSFKKKTPHIRICIGFATAVFVVTVPWFS